MIRALAASVLACLFLASIARADDGPPGVVQVDVQSPVVFGFLPPESDLFWQDEGAPEHEFHVRNALASAALCLKPKGIEFRMVYADALDLIIRGTTVSLDLRAAGGIGAYLIQPGTPPKLLTCSIGSSPLQILVPVIASEFFGHPECKPEEWRDIEVVGGCEA